MLDLVLYLYGLPEWGFLDVYTYIYIDLRYIMKCSYIWASKTVCVNHLNIYQIETNFHHKNNILAQNIAL